MRFVDVNPFFYPYRGGIENRMNDTARLLTEMGHEVIILTSRLPGTEEEEVMEGGYRVIRLKSKFINVYNPPFVTSENVYETLVSLDPDSVNYNYRWAPSYNRPMKRYDGRKLFTYHNMWGEGTGAMKVASEFNDWRFRSTLESFDHIISVSNYVKEDLVRRGIPADRITTIPNGFHCKPFVRGEEEDFILSLGRIVKVKGLRYLIEAMKDIDSKLVVCGKGPELKKLEKQAARMHLGDKVEFKGYVSEEEKHHLMDSCKLFVMPSLFEAFGIAAVELMSHGRPLVCTNVNGLPETVGDGAITVDPKSPSQLADAVNSLLSDDDYRFEMGEKARKQAESFAWENFTDLLERTVFGTKSEDRP